MYGVAIPTVSGLRNVFAAMNAQNGQWESRGLPCLGVAKWRHPV